ncbi:LuxR family transcriptional regulator, partial [Rubneribacter badeniensis]
SAPFPASAPARLGDADAPAEQTAAPLASRASEQDRRPKDSVRSRCERLARIHGLSDREFDVLELLAKGHTRVSVAKRLYVSENTVRVHVKNIYAKLGIHSKQQLIDLVDRQ